MKPTHGLLKTPCPQEAAERDDEIERQSTSPSGPHLLGAKLAGRGAVPVKSRRGAGGSAVGRMTPAFQSPDGAQSGGAWGRVCRHWPQRPGTQQALQTQPPESLPQWEGQCAAFNSTALTGWQKRTAPQPGLSAMPSPCLCHLLVLPPLAAEPHHATMPAV